MEEESEMRLEGKGRASIGGEGLTPAFGFGVCWTGCVVRLGDAPGSS